MFLAPARLETKDALRLEVACLVSKDEKRRFGCHHPLLLPLGPSELPLADAAAPDAVGGEAERLERGVSCMAHHDHRTTEALISQLECSILGTMSLLRYGFLNLRETLQS